MTPRKTPREYLAEHRQREREAVDAQTVTVACGFCGWSRTARFAIAREAAREHRERHHPETRRAAARRRRKAAGSCRRHGCDRRGTVEVSSGDWLCAVHFAEREKNKRRPGRGVAPGDVLIFGERRTRLLGAER